MIHTVALVANRPVMQSGGITIQPLALLSVAALLIALGIAGAVLVLRRHTRRELDARRSDLAILSEVGRAILSSPLDLAHLAGLIYQQAGQIVPTDLFQLGLFDGDRYRLLIWVVDGEHRPAAVFRLTPDSRGIIGWLQESRRSLLVRDFQSELDSLPARPRYVSANPPRSGVFVPLTAGETVQGVLVIQSRKANAFTERDLARLSIVANQAAAALENARLLQETRQHAAHLELLAEVSRQIKAIQPLPSLYRQIVELIREKFDECSVSYYECDPRNDALLNRASAPSDGAKPPAILKMGEGLIGQAAGERRPAFRRQVPEAPGDLLDWAPEEGRAELAVPVEIDERVLGVLYVQTRAGADIDEAGVSVFQSLAAQLAIAILEAQLYAAERHRFEQLDAMAQAARAVTSNLELDDLLDEVIDLVDERFGYDRARIFLLESGQLVFRAGAGGRAGRWAIEGLSYPIDGPGLIALAGRTGRPILAPDVSLHPDYIPGDGLEDTRTEMVAPMMMGPNLLGVFDVQSEHPGAFADEDLQTLQTLAGTLAVAVRNARLFALERRRRRLAEILREVSSALTSTLHLDDVLLRILDGLARVVTHDAASILLANELGELILRANRGAPLAEAGLGMPLDIKLFPPGSTLPATVPFAEVDHWGEYHHLLALPEPHACLGALLTLQGEHRGYLVVDRAGQKPFTADEIELVAAFASQASVAIENARLFTGQREEAWVSTALLQVAEATARATELTDVLQTVARLTPMLVGVDRCAVLLVADDEFVLAAYQGSGEVELPAAIETPPEQPPDGEAESPTAEDDSTGFELLGDSPLRIRTEDWPALDEMKRTGEPVVISSDQVTPPEMSQHFTGVVILLPLMAKGRVEGALVVGQSPGEAPFSAHRVRLIGGIANQAALAIESAKLTEAQQEEAWVSTALLQVAEAVAEQPTLEAGLETVARLAPMLVGIEKVVIYQWDGAEGIFRPSQAVGLEETALDWSALTATAGEFGIDLGPTGSSFQVTLPAHLTLAFGAETCMVWPLWARGDLLGALLVEQAAISGRRMNILNGIAHQVAMAMENARLSKEVAQQERLEKEMEVARNIQASFLPDACPVLPDWELCSIWRSAREVGGDFFDFIPLRAPDGTERWGVVIADVADKGVPAALFMALSKTLLRAAAINRLSPGATLARVNDMILADARSDLFVTVFYAILDPDSGLVRYAIGGHNPPVWLRRGRAAQVLPGSGIALGVLQGVEYDEYEIALEPGDSLVLFTDGITDAVDGHLNEFGLPRLLEVASEARTRPADRILHAIVSSVEEHVGHTEAFDDMTLVVAKRRQGPG